MLSFIKKEDLRTLAGLMLQHCGSTKGKRGAKVSFSSPSGRMRLTQAIEIFGKEMVHGLQADDGVWYLSNPEKCAAELTTLARKLCGTHPSEKTFFSKQAGGRQVAEGFIWYILKKRFRCRSVSKKKLSDALTAIVQGGIGFEEAQNAHANWLRSLIKESLNSSRDITFWGTLRRFFGQG